MTEPSAKTPPKPILPVKAKFLAPKTSRGRAARAILRKLPVLRDPDVQRMVALAGFAARTCARCESFDLEAGQRSLATSGDFLRATRVLTPTQMQKTKGGPWTEENGFDEKGQPIDEAGPRWEELGACRKKKQTLVFARQDCEEWS